uniref:Putative ribonuclease H-like domain-containing protein n=1 Tax=Tanacetum cinerariifolium TaxID=118510 RepID=A0A6L2J2I7_TANCI|nr:putative ribonuclease H-like domain-containing protein [Tanacetum cinerariifolium]
MDLESDQNNDVAKLPLLKQGDDEMWKLRIEQYFQVQDYALWDVIENGNSFNPVPRIIANADGTSTSTISCPVTTEEKAQKKNNVKARSMLLMALPNEHLLTFSQYKDAKTLFKAIQARFGGNNATNKTQKTLLKQMYENFNAPSKESLDSIFNRLQKIVSQSKPDLETISFDDLYNNFKIVEQEVKRTVISSSSSGSPNMAFFSSPSSTNEVDTASIQVSAASTPVSIVSYPDNTANLSYATVYAFLERYDKTKVECFNCHKMGHFARECRSPRSHESRPRNQDSSRKTVIVEDTSFKAMVAIDEVGFDWSYMADNEVPTNMALMAFFRLRELNKSEFDLANYKRGLAFVEEQLVFYKKNEVMFCDQIVVLKKDASFKESDIITLNLQLEKLKKEKESNQIKIDNFENASKSLDKFIGSHIIDNSKIGLGFTSYNVVAPPPTSLFAPQTIDLSNSGLEEFKQLEFESYGPKARKSVCVETSNVIKKVSDTPIIEDWVSNCNEDESEEVVLKFENVQHKPKQVNQPRKVNQNSRNKRTNWNEMGTHKLGVGFQFSKKACFETSPLSQTIKNMMEDLLLLHAVLKKICDKKNSVLFTETECLILSFDFKLPDENQVLLKFCGIKGNKREFSNARTPQLNGVAKRKNMTLIEAARTILADSLLHIPFWAKAVNTACYVYNRVLVTKPHNKTTYELLIGSKIHFDARHEGKEKVFDQEYILLPVLITSSDVPLSNEEVVSSPKDDAGMNHPAALDDFSKMPNLEDIRIFDDAYNDRDEGVEVDYNNLETVIPCHRQEEGIDYDEVFAPIARIEEISQPLGFVDLEFLDRVYKVEKALYGLHQAPRAWPDIMFAMCACSRFQVQPKVSHMHAVKRIFRYLKAHPTLGLWYPKDSPLELITYSDSDYTGASLDRKSTTGGCQFLFSRLISWQCKKQTIVANSTTKVEYIVASSCCRQVLWLQNQLLDYGYNFMQTKIHVDNESAICVVKNHVYHSKTKHIEIRHNFIRDSYKKRLIEMVKIHTDSNVADLLTKAFDVTRFQFLVASIEPFSSLNHSIAILKFVDQHNMVAYLEKSDDNTEFHQIVDFLSLCSITYALIEEGDRVERAITTDASLEAAQDSDNIIKTLTTAMPNVDIPQGIDTGGSPRCQETIGGTSAQTRSKRVLEQPNEPPLLKGGYTPGSDEGGITLAELMESYATLSKRKRSRAVIYSSDEKGPSVHIEDSPKQGRIIEEMDKDENINLVSEQGEVQETAEHSKDDDETLAETLLNIKRSSAKDKGKGIMQETELPKKLKKKEMIQLKLQRQLNQRKENVSKGDQAKEIDWNDPQEDIRPLFERIWDQVYTFVPKDSEIEREVMKRAIFDLQQRSSKKQRLDKQTEETEEEAKAQGAGDQEVEELKLYMRIIHEEDIAIEAIPLAIKPPVIIEYKITKEGKFSTYHITRADGSIRRYTSMINLLENINREDLETFWNVVKDKYDNTRLEEGYKRVLCGDLKVMFEPNVESGVWRQLQGHEVSVWKLFFSCGVHFVRFNNLYIFLLLDKVYPFTPTTIKMMLERKLQAD